MDNDGVELIELIRLSSQKSSGVPYEGYAKNDLNLPGRLLIVESADAIYSFAEEDIIDREPLRQGRTRIWVCAGARAFRLSAFVVDGEHMGALLSPLMETPFSFTTTTRTVRPQYGTMDSHYSQEAHDCPDISPSPNQCAVRLSRALILSGVSMDVDYPGNLCRHGYARGAQDLGAFLKTKWGVRDFGFEAPGNAPSQITGTKGVILFANIPGFAGQGHIDLWNGSATKTGEYWNANPIWFWKLA